MSYSSINPNLYVDYGNMIHFPVTASASEMSLYWGASNEFIAMNKIFTMKIHCNEKYAMKTMKDFD